MTTQDIVQRLWSLCHVLRDDGITYHQYVTELTFLLFLKMAEETNTQGQLPEGWRWRDLASKDGLDQLTYYRTLLIHLGTEGSPRVQSIFANAATSLRQPRSLAKLVENIDGLDWYSARTEGLGDLYEGLLEKNASESKSGAGQYFTPRPLIECIVELVKPQPGEHVQDPAAGTGGFLVMADRFVKRRTDDLFGGREASLVERRDRRVLLPGDRVEAPSCIELCHAGVALRRVPEGSGAFPLQEDGSRGRYRPLDFQAHAADANCASATCRASRAGHEVPASAQVVIHI